MSIRYAANAGHDSRPQPPTEGVVLLIGLPLCGQESYRRRDRDSYPVKSSPTGITPIDRTHFMAATVDLVLCRFDVGNHGRSLNPHHCPVGPAKLLLLYVR